MRWDVAGIGNALIDALVVADDAPLIAEFELNRGTMHLVDEARWREVYERIRTLDVMFDSGGSCANTVATVGRLGGRALFAGQVGDDQMGREYASHIEKACGGHALRFAPGEHTGKCLSIISSEDAERTMLTNLGASVTLPELGDFEDALRNTRVAHFTGYTLLDGPMRPLVCSAMETAAGSGALVSLDAADPFVVASHPELMWDLVRRWADVVFLNREEALALVGGTDPVAACRKIADEGGVRTVVVKLGARGSVVSHDGELSHIDVYRVDAVDTTGAGDAYAGGYLYGMTQGYSPALAGRLASAVAGLAVAQIGAVVRDLDRLQAVRNEISRAA